LARYLLFDEELYNDNHLCACFFHSSTIVFADRAVRRRDETFCSNTDDSQSTSELSYTSGSAVFQEDDQLVTPEEDARIVKAMKLLLVAHGRVLTLSEQRVSTMPNYFLRYSHRLPRLI
jgi:hypothetical protein